MRKLRIGVWLREDFSAEAGGAFGYYYQIIKKINAYNFADAEITFLSKNEINDFECERKYIIKWRPYIEARKNRYLHFIERKFRYAHLQEQKQKKRKENEQHLKDELNKLVDVIYYPGI